MFGIYVQLYKIRYGNCGSLKENHKICRQINLLNLNHYLELHKYSQQMCVFIIKQSYLTCEMAHMGVKQFSALNFVMSAISD